MSRRALLFDLDGTLVNSDPSHFQSFREVAARHGVCIDEEYFVQQMSGQSNDAICKALWPSASQAERREFAAEKEVLFRSTLSGIPAITGLFPLLDWADQRGLGLAVVSNAPMLNIEAIVTALGLERRFSILISGELLERGKPDPLPYATALARLGVAAKDAVAFEDATPGITAAVRAGIPTVGVATTQTPTFLTAAGATLAIRDFADPLLLPFLADRLGGSCP